MNDDKVECGCDCDNWDDNCDIIDAACRFGEAIRLLREFIKETESGPPSLGLREKTVTFLDGVAK